MSKKINLKLADIVISISPIYPTFEIGVSSEYEKFCTNESPDVILKIDMDELPSMQLASPVYKTNGPWNLYAENGKWIISVNGPPGTGLMLVAKFDKDYHRGEIIINKNIPVKSPFYPLIYPMDELLGSYAS